MLNKEDITITISKEDKLKVTPQVAEVYGGSRVTFRAEVITGKVYIPQPILVPVDAAVDEFDPVEAGELVFEVKPEAPAVFRAVDQNVALQYFVTREVFGGFTEAVAIPPVMIIKKGDS